MVASRSRVQGSDEDIDRDVRIVSARQLLSQVFACTCRGLPSRSRVLTDHPYPALLSCKIYYRQNMYVLAAQDLDGEDMLRYLVPSVIFTGISAFLGFCGSSAMVSWCAANWLRNWR